MAAEPNMLPGSEYIGFGFNALETYDFHSATTQLFALKGPATTWKDPISGTVYTVPPNMAPTSESVSETRFQAFQGSEAFSQDFAAMAQISSSGRYFSREFDATYGSLRMHNAAYYFAMAQMRILLWGVQVQNIGIDYLSGNFTDNPTVENLPSTFNPQTQNDFYELFDHFGTHFISHVDVGGRLDYLCAVSQQAKHDEDEVKGNLEFEYKGYFAETKGEAEGFWQKAGQSWASSRQGLIQAHGGDSSIIDSLTFPSYGQFKPHVLPEWSKSVRANPGASLIKLRPLSVLFSGEQARAIDEALRSYANDSISVSAEATTPKAPTAAIHVLGKSVTPSITPGPKQELYWLALFDDEGNVLFNEATQFGANKLIEAAEAAAATHSRCWLAFAVSNGMGAAYPKRNCASFLEGFGVTLSDWREDLKNSGFAGIAYTCVGRQGWSRGSAKESYTYLAHDQPAERVEVAALTRPQFARAQPRGEHSEQA